MDERDNLGFFFSGHPLDDYEVLIKKYTTLNLADLENAAAGRGYSLIAMIKTIKEIFSKTGKRMAFVEVEDKNGSMELVVFSDVFARYRELLEENQVRAFFGKIDTSRGEPSFIVDEILPPSKIKHKKAGSVHIRIARDFLNEDNSYQLRDYLFDQKGGCLLYFHLAGNGHKREKVIKAAPQLTVSAEPEVLSKLKLYPQVIDVWSE